MNGGGDLLGKTKRYNSINQGEYTTKTSERGYMVHPTLRFPDVYSKILLSYHRIVFYFLLNRTFKRERFTKITINGDVTSRTVSRSMKHPLGMHKSCNYTLTYSLVK